MNKIFLSFLCLCLLLSGSAQDLVKPVGKVTKATTSGNELQLITANARIAISIFSPSIIRVRATAAEPGADFSYAVIAKPQPGALVIEQTTTEIKFHTDSLNVIIQKDPFSIQFYTPDNRLINEDEQSLSISWIGTEVTDYKHLQEGERFIGLGEKTGNLDRAGNGYTNWNSDVYGYSVAADPLYSTIPFYMGLHHGLSYGIFFDNSFQSDFNFGASNDRFSSFGAKGGEMNYYFIYHTQVAGIIRSYTALTGRMPMPPRWSLGYQQNRYSYYPDTEVIRIAQTLREKKIPADGITLDIHYMDAYKLFTWNKERFPDPKAMIGQLNNMGFKTTLIVDPGIKVEKGYPSYESGTAQNIFLKYSDGKSYTGQVWPGWCNFPDFTSDKGRAWWKNEIKNYTSIGVAGIWNDMNEIATWGQKMPSNILFDYDGHPTTHLKGHNVFGMQMARSSYEAAKTATQKRPFILTRSGYAGLQRYTAIWTGDNRAEDDHMMAGVRLLSSLGLSGVSFTGMDIGGFTGNPTPALYTRWMQLGAFIPYFRNHTALNSKAAEPWTFGEDILDISRNYINLRYRLLPYLYSVFYESTQSGMPVVRSLAIDYSYDPVIYDPAFQNQFLCGPSLLVIPQEGYKQFSKVYLPAGDWYDLYDDKKETGGTTKLIELAASRLPVYVKAGSIIPVQSLTQSTIEKPTDTLSIHIYYGNAANSFELYEDDGETYNYEKGSFCKRMIRLDPATRSIQLDKTGGSMPSAFHYLRLALHGFDQASLKVDNASVSLKEEKVSFLGNATVEYGTMGTPVKTIIIGNKPGKIELRY